MRKDIGILLVTTISYIGSYFYLSVRGEYLPQLVSNKERYMLVPLITYPEIWWPHKFQDHRGVSLLYYPLVQFDREFWHKNRPWEWRVD